MEPTITELVEQAGREIEGSLFAPKATGGKSFSFATLIWAVFSGMTANCPDDPEKAVKRVRAAATKAAKSKDEKMAPEWVFDCCNESGITGKAQKLSAIHAALMWVGTHPERAETIIMTRYNDESKAPDDSAKSYTVEEELGDRSSDDDDDNTQDDGE